MYTDQNSTNIDLFCKATDSIKQVLENTHEPQDIICKCIIVFLVEMNYIDFNDIVYMFNNEKEHYNRYLNQLEGLIGRDFRHED